MVFLRSLSFANFQSEQGICRFALATPAQRTRLDSGAHRRLRHDATIRHSRGVSPFTCSVVNGSCSGFAAMVTTCLYILHVAHIGKVSCLPTRSTQHIAILQEDWAKSRQLVRTDHTVLEICSQTDTHRHAHHNTSQSQPTQTDPHGRLSVWCTPNWTLSVIN